MRGATSSLMQTARGSRGFNPRAPCGARRAITTPITGHYMFQSTRPMRGATSAIPLCYFVNDVSIHAPHAGRDLQEMADGHHFQCFNPRAPCGARPTRSGAITSTLRFNPRAPCGARRMQIVYPPRGAMFQSTRPMRGATPTPGTERAWRTVSIHAPHAGRDLSIVPRITGFRFQSTRPMRGATDDAGGAAGR